MGRISPVDLEGLSAIPGKPGLYMALASAGPAMVVEFNSQTRKIVIQSSYNLPSLPAKPNLEGISIQMLDGKMIMAWGHRGELPELNSFFACALDAKYLPTGSVTTASLAIPWPTAAGTRGISDLKVDASGSVFVCSAADAGNDGPFQSVLYAAGTISAEADPVKFRASVPSRLFWTDQHKIEAFDLLPGRTGGVIFGTDDENLGGSVWSNFWPD